VNVRSLLTVATGFALAGCAGVRKDAPPQAAIQAPATWHMPTGATDTPLSRQWWAAFGDPVLNALVEEGLAHSDDIALAATRVEEARAQFRLAHAQRLPDVRLSIEGGRNRDVNPGFGVPEQQAAGEGIVEASFDTDLFGRLKANSAAARSALLASEDARDAVRLSVAASIANGYLTLLALDARLVVVRETLEVRRKELGVEQRRFDAGYSSQLELTQAQAELAATEELVPSTKLAIARQENGLSELLGRNPASIERRGASFESLNISEVPVALPSTLVRVRPDLAAAEAKLAASDHSLDAARAAFLPDIKLAATAGTFRSTLVDASPVAIWSIGASILAPLFDAGRLDAQQDAATAQRDEAAFAYRKAVIRAFREVEDALATVSNLAEEDAALSREREVLTHTLDVASKRYREGYSSYLDQLDAQRNLLSVRLSLVQSRLNRLNAIVSLCEALGGGWVPEIERPS
jgi:multidrug efflux system outer membrane protein